MAEWESIHADILEVFEIREQADPGEHADAGDKDKADMLRAALDDAVDTAQRLPVGPRARAGSPSA